MQQSARLSGWHADLVRMLHVATLTGLVERQELLVALTLQVILAYDALLVLELRYVLVAVVGNQMAHDGGIVGSRMCAHYHAVRIYGSHLHRRVERGCSGTAHDDRSGHAAALQFLTYAYHLVERWRYKSRQSYHGCILLLSRINDDVAVNHHSEILHFEAVTLCHHRYDVLPYVVYVALHRGHDDGVVFRVFRITRSTLIILISLHIRLQHADGLLHHACRLHHLRQEHLALAEELPYPIHGRHQILVNHAQRCACLLVSLLGVLVYVVGHAL